MIFQYVVVLMGSPSRQGDSTWKTISQLLKISTDLFSVQQKLFLIAFKMPSEYELNLLLRDLDDYQLWVIPLVKTQRLSFQKLGIDAGNAYDLCLLYKTLGYKLFCGNRVFLDAPLTPLSLVSFTGKQKYRLSNTSGRCPLTSSTVS